MGCPDLMVSGLHRTGFCVKVVFVAAAAGLMETAPMAHSCDPEGFQLMVTEEAPGSVLQAPPSISLPVSIL